MDAMRCLACLVVFVIPTALSAGQSSLPIAGQWIPRDPVKAEALFAVGLTDVTAAGVTIEENGDSLRIVRKDADGALERMQKVNDRFEIESVYALDRSRSTAAAKYYANAAGAASWDGRQLVVETASRHARRRSVYAVEDGALHEVTVVTLASGIANTVSQYYARPR